MKGRKFDLFTSTRWFKWNLHVTSIGTLLKGNGAVNGRIQFTVAPFILSEVIQEAVA